MIIPGESLQVLRLNQGIDDWETFPPSSLFQSHVSAYALYFGPAIPPMIDHDFSLSYFCFETSMARLCSVAYIYLGYASSPRSISGYILFSRYPLHIPLSKPCSFELLDFLRQQLVASLEV